MPASHQRMLPLTEARRLPIKLDDATWTAIDWLAGQGAMTWQRWCVRSLGKEGQSNATAALRAAAMEGLLMATVLQDRGEQLAAMDRNAFTRNSAAVDDSQFEDALEGAAIGGWCDFGVFSVGFGFDRDGRDFLAVRNGMRDGQHFLALESSRAANS